MTAVLINPYILSVTGDPNFASVVLLLHCDGANAATTLTDSSNAHHTVTCTGNHKLTTAQAMFGSASLDCTTTGAGAASTGDSADWLFGNGQFTIEAFVRPTSNSGSRVIAGQWATSNRGWDFGWFGSNLSFFYSTTGSDAPSVAISYTPTLNSWVHVAVDRDASNVLRIYAAGSVLTSATVSATFFDSTRNLAIGNDGSAAAAFPGQIDELRITKGVARYGGAFTPPTAPFPDS